MESEILARDERNKRRRERNRELRGTKPIPKRDLVGQLAIEHTKKFWNLVKKDGEDGCWWWLGSYQHPDYGNRTPMFNPSRRSVFKSKSVAWAIVNGRSNQGYVPHLRAKCRNPCCVNPGHHRPGSDFNYNVGKPLAERLLVDFERNETTVSSIAYATSMSERKTRKMLNDVSYGRECMDHVYAMRTERKIGVEKEED